MIEFQDVSFAYGSKRILQNASFSIGFQEKTAILGGSGEGKTTILKLMLRLIMPQKGAIIIDGIDITHKTEQELRDIRSNFSIVFQEGALFDSLNVKENVAFCLREYTQMNESQIDIRVRELLRLVDLEGAINLSTSELSGGMHRRVAIARSLAAFNPKMFLYDEPTAGLDPINSDNICRLITDLSSPARGFIIVTHKVTDALKTAERFMFLKQGRIVLDGDKRDLIETDNQEIQRFLHELYIKVN